MFIPYQLVHVDVSPCGNGLPKIATVVAISHSEDLLKDYCLNTLKGILGKPKTFTWNSYYVIEPSEIKMIEPSVQLPVETEFENLSLCGNYKPEQIALKLTDTYKSRGLTADQSDQAALVAVTCMLKIGVYPAYHPMIKKTENLLRKKLGYQLSKIR